MTAPIRCPKCGEWLYPNIMGGHGYYWTCLCGYNPNNSIAVNQTYTPNAIGTKAEMDSEKESEGSK